MGFYVVVHGGAGLHAHETGKGVKRALRRACSEAIESLQGGSASRDAVEKAIILLEDAECLNAGHGSNLTVNGTVECDSSIMDNSGAFGGVGAVSGVKNPIRAARAVLDYSTVQNDIGRVPPLLLVSQGAHDFATFANIETVGPQRMISDRASREWKKWSSSISKSTSPLQGVGPISGSLQDTVGSVIQDDRGNICTGVSSGGLLLKLPGRVGEAAIFGAGIWAEQVTPELSVGVSVSGTGEAIIRMSLARLLAEAFQSEDPHRAVEDIFKLKLPGISASLGGQHMSAGAVILVREIDASGSSGRTRLWCIFNTESMAIAYASSEMLEARSIILRQPNGHNGGSPHPFYLTMLPWTKS